LGVQDALTQVAPRLVKLHIGQQQKQVYLVSEQYLDQGKVHYLVFITDVQQLLYEEERQAWQKLLRVLSHEVNNSLTPICAISQGLQKQLQQNQPPDAALLSEALQVMNERAQGLNQFMKSYQQLNRLPPPEKQLLALDQLVADVCALFSNQVKRIGPQLNVFADPAQLQQLLVNLLKNALEANEGQDTAVTVCWEQQGKLLVLTVTDQGAGIQNPDNLFVPFYSTKPHGSGIGLVLSRQIARNHGGDLQLYNRTPAQGAQSRLLLPL
jgi:nitrogen fixation/metabolism regulation signal transduction histidine kinase